MKRYIVHALTAVGLLFFVACSDNPIADEHDGDEELSVASFDISDDHLSTLEEITFTVRVVDHHGEVATDAEVVEVQFRLVDTETWRGSDMTLQGSDYVGTRTFATSGDYEVRVVAAATAQDEPAAIFEMEDVLEVERAHKTVGDYRVEYESFPGHIHQGETAQIAFWVFEGDGDVHGGGHAHGVQGLQAEIHCGDPSGAEEMHQAVGSEEGMYTAMHTFEAAGEAHMGFEFEAGGQEYEVDFHIEIAHGH